MQKKILSVVIFACIFSFQQSHAQLSIDVQAFPKKNSTQKSIVVNTTSVPNSDNYGGGLKINFDEKGSKYLRFMFWNQIWFRNIEQNPGTLVNGEPSKNSIDIGLRRVRILAYAQINQRFLVLVHLGVNNQTFTNGGAPGTTGVGSYGAAKKPAIFFHEAIAEFAVVPSINPKTQKNNLGSLYIGGGLHFWNGISRMTSASTITMMTLDVPISNWPLIENSDQFARQLGVYAKGEIWNFNYRFSVNKPFTTNITPPAYSATKGSMAVDNNGKSNAAVQGYVEYQFFDHESQLLPYKAGTYLGTKKVLNLGLGFYHQSQGTRSYNSNGAIQKHDINLIGADIFADVPLGNKKWGMALTLYSVYYKYLFGPNYIRSIGIMNIASDVDTTVAAADRPLQGAGNSAYLIGTGDIWYTQMGFLLPKFSDKVRLQPYVAYSLQNFQYLDALGHNIDFGANIFVHGHNAKITPQYSLRPLWFNRDGKYVSDGYKGQFTLQLQVFI